MRKLAASVAALAAFQSIACCRLAAATSGVSWTGSGATKLATGAADGATGSETMESGAAETAGAAGAAGAAGVTLGVLAAARAAM